jgi:putative effector of murein hydrolase
MKNFQLAIAAATVMSTVALPLSAQATQVKKHHKLATVAAGVAGYEVAKHSHNKFAKKHRFAAGVASAVVANKMMKAHDKKVAAHGH